MNFNVETKEFVQIIHTGEGHRFTVSTIGTVHPEVLIYDSMYSTLPMLAKAQIASLLSTQQPTIKVKLMDVQMQSGKFQFEQSKMRYHLQKCLKGGEITMVPVLTRRGAKRFKSTTEFNVYCTCHMLDLIDTHYRFSVHIAENGFT